MHALENQLDISLPLGVPLLWPQNFLSTNVQLSHFHIVQLTCTLYVNTTISVVMGLGEGCMALR